MQKFNTRNDRQKISYTLVLLNTLNSQFSWSSIPKHEFYTILGENLGCQFSADFRQKNMIFMTLE